MRKLGEVTVRTALVNETWGDTIQMAAKRNDDRDSRRCVDELGDACLCLAVHNVAEICAAIRQELGQSPELQAICDVLAYAITCLPDDAIIDANPSAVTFLSAKITTRRKVDTRPGSLFAVPGPDGRFHFVVLIACNRFGWAFGVLSHVSESSHYRPPNPTEIERYPVYTGGRFVTNGRWRRVGYVPEILALFPQEPEIYHRKTDFPMDDRIGAHGSAENARAQLRTITEQEAEEIGLLTQEYPGVLIEEEFESFLAARTTKRVT